MKTTNLKRISVSFLSAIALMAGINACQDVAVNPDSAAASDEVLLIRDIGPVGGTECNVTNLSGGDLNWFNSKIILLHGEVRVPAGSTLTISKGTIIKGEKASKASLVIMNGAKINAVGTFDEPIVFTSDQPVGSRAPRDWGGVIILGSGVSNLGTNIVPEGFLAAGTTCGANVYPGPPTYGGTNNADNSGKLSFARIEFAGIPIVSGNEKNSLTMYGVGSGTKIDHIQCSYGGDDSFEWFGGAVNMSYLISYRTQDDDFDTDNGFSGQVQYGVAFRDPALADNSTSNGFESDNDATGTGNLPQTSAKFSNFTLIGPYDPNCARTVVNNAGVAVFGDGLHLRRNTALKVYNTVMTGWPLRQAFVAAGVTGVTLSNNTAVKPFSVAASLCFAEPAGGPWTADATNLCKDATLCTANANAGTGMIKQASLTAAAWDLSLANPLFPSVQASQNSIGTKNGIDATTLGAPYFTANYSTYPPASTTFFRGAQRFAGDNGWRTGKAWINYDPQNEPYN